MPVGELEATNYYIHKAAQIMELGTRVERLLLMPEAEHTVSVPIQLDNGDLGVFVGHRVQHNSARGPMKEGLRYHPTVDPDDVRALASVAEILARRLTTTNKDLVLLIAKMLQKSQPGPVAEIEQLCDRLLSQWSF